MLILIKLLIGKLICVGVKKARKRFRNAEISLSPHSLSHGGGGVFLGDFLWQDQRGQGLLWFWLRDWRGYGGLQRHVRGFDNRI